MFLRYPFAFLKSLVDDYQRHLTPQLQRMAAGHAAPGVHDITPAVEALERAHGRALLQLDTQHGSWPFIRSILRSTRPHL